MGRVFFRYLAYGLMTIFGAVQLGSQFSSAAVVITTLPTWGQDGTLTGYVSGLPANQVTLYVFEFIPDVGWVSLPGCGPATIQNGGQFSIDTSRGLIDRYATRFSAYLVPANLGDTPCLEGAPSIPFLIVHNALSSVSYPRIANYKTLSFGGLTWYVKTAPVQVWPNGQYFLDDNAFVDQFGQLHLKVSQCSGSWCAAEIFTTQAVGYGSYTFTLGSPAGTLDPNLTLGLFTWDGQATDQSNREWDIEFSRWGNANSASNAQYVVQPYTGPNNIFKFLMSPANASVHTVNWTSSQVAFASGTPPLPIASWTYPSSPSGGPTPGDVHLHLNLYVGSGAAPASKAATEIVISNFQYVPATAQVAFGRIADSVPFYSASNTVPITGSPGCAATVESDSPWLSITGSSTAAAGGTIGYTAADNYGSARSGNIMMRSTGCNPTLDHQILSVTQSGLVCDPTFGSPSTSIGFVQSVRSVVIRASAPACTWSVTPSVPWLQIASPAGGTGDGSITFAADSNPDLGLRTGLLVLNNGHFHSVLQDAAGAGFALSPSVASACKGQEPHFGASWTVNGSVEIHLNGPTGPSIGLFGAPGTTALPALADGTAVYLIQAGTGVVLASATASVTTDCTAPTIGALGLVNAASYSATSISAGSFVSLFGSNLSPSTAQPSSLPYPTSLGGVSVIIAGEKCGLTYVSPSQINFVVPSDVPPGRYVISAGAATTEAIITTVSPGIFTVNGTGTGVPLAQVTAVLQDGTQVPLAPYQCSTSCTIAPMTLPANTTDVYIVLYGTGFRNLSKVMVGGTLTADVVYSGAVPTFPGLDQMNLHLKTITGLTGVQSVRIQVDGVFSNSVDLQFN